MRINFRPYGQKIAKYYTWFPSLRTENNTNHAHGRPCVYHRSLKIHSMWCKLSKPTYTEVDNSPKSLASSLTGESVLTFSESSSFLVFGVFKTGWPFTSADARTHDSTRQYDACKPTASDITGIRIQLYNNQCTMQTAFVYDLLSERRQWRQVQTVHKSRVLCDTINAACAMQCRCSYDNCKVWETAYAYRLLLLYYVFTVHTITTLTHRKRLIVLNGNNIRPIHTNFRSVTSQCHTPSQR